MNYYLFLAISSTDMTKYQRMCTYSKGTHVVSWARIRGHDEAIQRSATGKRYMDYVFIMADGYTLQTVNIHPPEI